MKALSLFAGIGGFDLALQARGHEVVGQVEIAGFQRGILQKRFPGTLLLGDIREADGTEFGDYDLMVGGYPCQPFSHSGKRGGEDDPRHMWPEARRLLSVARPRFALFENVTGHLSLGFGEVLRDLADLGYPALWDCIPAQFVGAPHRRDRVWILASRDAFPQEMFSGRTKGLGLATNSHPEKWPRAGAFANRLWWEREPMAPIRQVKGAWPTPTANPSIAASVGALRKEAERLHPQGGYTLGTKAVTRPGRMWPTPAAADGKRGPDYNRINRPKSGGDDLVTAVARHETYPTPKARGYRSPRGKVGLERDTPDLNVVAWDREGRPPEGGLNPEWVEYLMGFPVGWTDPELGIISAPPIPWGSDLEPARLTTRSEGRPKRIMSLGNAVVPQVVGLILSQLERVL